MSRWRKERYKERGGKFMVLKNGLILKESRAISGLKRKIQILQKVSGLKVPECFYCKLIDIRLLAINHKNGGGQKEKKARNYSSILNFVATGKRKINDLEVCCFNCNILDDYNKGRKFLPANWEEIYKENVVMDLQIILRKPKQ